MCASTHYPTLYYENKALVMLDQRLLPFTEQWRRYEEAPQVASAITDMVVRGAPAIGIAAAFGVVLSANKANGELSRIHNDIAILRQSRPTAVNLFWALDEMAACLAENGPHLPRLEKTAQSILDGDIAACKAMGDFGAALIEDGATILTHCNAGALATGGWGTALGVIRSMRAAGKSVSVLADETRPRCQGGRLTAYELARDGIDVTIIPDTAAAWMMAQNKVSAVVVGADRIAANGDVCNKIGTYQVALAAKAHQVPFYVAAPRSTIDPGCAHGGLIPIEERPSTEVTHLGETPLTAPGVPVLNPAFDVTPAGLVTAIITEVGIFKPNQLDNVPHLAHHKKTTVKNTGN